MPANDSDGSVIMAQHAQNEIDAPTTAARDAVPGTNELMPAPSTGASKTEMLRAEMAEVAASARSFHKKKGERPYTNLPDVRGAEEETNTFNIIVAGHQGQGKTTAAMSLFDAFTDDSALTSAATSYQTQECRLLEEQIRAAREKKEEKEKEEKIVASGLDGRERDIPRAKQLKVEILEIDTIIEELTQQREAAQQASIAKAEEFNQLGQKIQGCKTRRAEETEARDYEAVSSIDVEIEQLEERERELRNELREDVNMIGGTADMNGPTEPTTAVLRQKWKFSIKCEKKTLKVTITDTPGYGDELNVEAAIDRVVSEVAARFTDHEQARIQGGVKFMTRQEEDSLYHVCLYFIQPHRLARIDEIFLKKLSPFVNIIPVLAKADTMTRAERESHRQQIRVKLDALGVQPYEFDPENVAKYVHKLNKECYAEEIAEHGQPDYKMPLAIVSPPPNSVGREYLWGTADASNPLHSDMPCLREMVVRTEPYRLRKATERLFHRWSEDIRQNEELSAAATEAARAQEESEMAAAAVNTKQEQAAAATRAAEAKAAEAAAVDEADVASVAGIVATVVAIVAPLVVAVFKR
jgi:septin family protein